MGGGTWGLRVGSKEVNGVWGARRAEGPALAVQKRP